MGKDQRKSLFVLDYKLSVKYTEYQLFLVLREYVLRNDEKKHFWQFYFKLAFSFSLLFFFVYKISFL